MGTDIPSMLKNDLALEYHVVGVLKDAMKICEEKRIMSPARCCTSNWKTPKKTTPISSKNNSA